MFSTRKSKQKEKISEGGLAGESALGNSQKAPSLLGERRDGPGAGDQLVLGKEEEGSYGR